jgi:uncharacterized protein (TIGR02246 family)
MHDAVTVRSFLPVAVVLLAFTSCARVDTTSQADVEAIAAARARVEAAENAGSADGMMAEFTDDVVFLAPNRQPLSGAAAVGEYLRAGLQTNTMTLHYTSQEIIVSGDWAFDRGTYHATVTPKGAGTTSSEQGKYLWVCRRGADRSWKFARVMWNNGPRPET